MLAASCLAQDADFDTLIGRLDNRDPKIRREAAKRLGEIGDRRATPALGKVVKDLDEETRFRAVEGISSLLDREGIPFLVEALKDPSRRVKQTSIDGMVTLYISTHGPGGIKGVFNKTVEVFRRSSDDLVVPPGTEVDPRIIDALGGTVGDPDNDTARDAARALGILRGSKALFALGETLFHAPNTVKVEILKSIQKVRGTPGSEQISKDVARLLPSTDKDVRGQAAYTLGLLAARDQSAALGKLFTDDKDRGVQRYAFEALSLMPSPEQESWFAGFLEDRDEHLRECAADALGRLPSTANVEKLRTVHGPEKNARARLAQAFALTAHGSGEFLGELMQSLESTFNRQYGQAYLIELGRDGSRFPAYYPYLRSSSTDIRHYLCDVFGALANPAALDQVKPLIQDPKGDVVTAAIRAVQIMEKMK